MITHHLQALDPATWLACVCVLFGAVTTAIGWVFDWFD